MKVKLNYKATENNFLFLLNIFSFFSEISRVFTQFLGEVPAPVREHIATELSNTVTTHPLHYRTDKYFTSYILVRQSCAMP